MLQQKSRVADSQSLIPPSQADLWVFENRLDVLITLFAAALFGVIIVSLFMMF